MRRREVLALLTAAAAASPVRAQAPRRPRIGYLSGGLEGSGEFTIEILKTALREFGWRAGETVAIEERWANGDFARLPSLRANSWAWGSTQSSQRDRRRRKPSSSPRRPSRYFSCR